MFKKARNQKGFTLIELIAIIAILGILSLLVVPKVTDYTKKAKVSKAKANLVILKNAIERYNIEHEDTLEDELDEDITFAEDDLQKLLTKKTDKDGDVSDTGKFGPYIDKIPNEWENATVEDVMDYDPEALNENSFDDSDQVNDFD